MPFEIKDFFELLNILLPTILSVGLFFGIYYFRILGKLYKVLTFYLLSALLIDITGRVLGEVYGNNLILIPLFGFIELLIFSILYYHFMLLRKYKFILIIVGLALATILVETWKVRTVDPSNFQSYGRVLDAFVIILLSLLYYFNVIHYGKEGKTYNLGLNTVILIYFSLNLLIFLPLNFLLNESSELKIYFWLTNSILTFLFYAYIARSIWKNGKTRQPLLHG
jgi:hypothetical protein